MNSLSKFHNVPEEGEEDEEGGMISPPSVTGSLDPDPVARAKQHVLLQVPPAAQTFSLKVHLYHNLGLSLAMPINSFKANFRLFVGKSLFKRGPDLMHRAFYDDLTQSVTLRRPQEDH